MLPIVLAKLSRNRWLVSCVLAGAVIALSLVASIPLYTSAILQRLLTRDLETFQERQGYFAGRYTIFGSLRPTGVGSSSYPELDQEIQGRLPRDLGLPVLASTRLIAIEGLRAVPAIPRQEEPAAEYLDLAALSEAPPHLAVLTGRVFRSEGADDVVEVVASPQAMARHDLRVGEAYALTDSTGAGASALRVLVVGVCDVGDPQDLWWFQSMSNYENTLLADYDVLRRIASQGRSPSLSRAMWSFAFDYHAITLGNVGRVSAALAGQLARIEGAGLGCDSHMLPILSSYVERERELRTTLWFLHVPVLVLIVLYVSMLSVLIVESESTEISLLKSRGASASQVLLVYLLESSLLGGVALLAGPPLGLVLCKVMGASNGFLELVRRAPLAANLSLTSYLYAAGCSLVLILAMLLPAARAARLTIVIHKQRRARPGSAPAWRRYGVDLILLAVTAVGVYGYRWRRTAAALGGGGLPLDPVLFVVSTTFVLGAGLLFLRVYPLLLRTLFWAGRRAWPPGLYAAILGVGRSAGREQAIMLFLILALSVGVLNARTARTIGRNVTEAILYSAGADIVLMENWATGQPPAGVSVAVAPAGAPLQQAATTLYVEPRFDKYSSLRGASLATRVFRTKGAYGTLQSGRTMKVSLMGVVPEEFAEVAWFRPSLLPHHWHAYLNLLAGNPNAFIVSESAATRYGVQVGDALDVTWSGQGYLDGVVQAVVPYWPTYDPYEAPEATVLVVANLTYLQAKMATEPYEVWIRKAPGATSAEVYAALEGKEIDIAYLRDAAPALIAARNDPLVQGTNGALSMGFAVTMVVCLIGFLTFWIVAIESRVLQLGVFRAMGLSRRAIVGMLAWEQLLVTVVAIATGIVIGGVAADVFVPLVELARKSPRVPPFVVTAASADYVTLYVFIGVMLAVGITVLGARISRIGMAQAVKLGED